MASSSQTERNSEEVSREEVLTEKEVAATTSGQEMVAKGKKVISPPQLDEDYLVSFLFHLVLPCILYPYM